MNNDNCLNENLEKTDIMKKEIVFQDEKVRVQGGDKLKLQKANCIFYKSEEQASNN